VCFAIFLCLWRFGFTHLLFPTSFSPPPLKQCGKARERSLLSPHKAAPASRPSSRRAPLPWRAQPQPLPWAGGSRRPARRVRGRGGGGPGIPPPWERAPLTQARPRVSQAPSRSARRTSSSAGTLGASPPSGSATRTTTARITATRRIAVSVRPRARRARPGSARFPAALRLFFMNE